ncbi:MAG: transposase [Planctomycetales bacterium 71-10]|nr:MAG: transposase [Planctomycetales bacterium 71-10]
MELAWVKKNLAADGAARRGWIDPQHPSLSVRRQCELMGLGRASLYREPARESDEDLRLMRLIDEQYLATPFYGSRRMAAWLDRRGESVNRKRVQRLMRIMGLEAIQPGPRTTNRSPDHESHPYLLRGVTIDRRDQVWSTDVTYLPLVDGYMFLAAVIDWHSRFVLSWRLSNTLDGRFCLEALDDALQTGRPEIFNTDQGCQFTANAFTGRLKEEGVAISMDGRGRALDNVFVERLWRSLKYEEVYLKSYRDVPEMEADLERWFAFYNHERLHQSLDYRTPAEVYRDPTPVNPRGKETPQTIT